MILTLFVNLVWAGDPDAQGIDDMIAAQKNAAEVNEDVSVDSVATIPFSSGTTGVPKGVVLTHRNIVSNLEQLYPGEGRYVGKDSVLLVPLPFFHIFGMVVGLLMGCRRNSKVVFLPAFDLERFLQLAQNEKATRCYVVPPIILALAKHPLVDKYNLSSVKAILSGAAPLGGDVQDGCAARLKCVVKQAWGMTELSPGGTCTADDEVSTAESRKVIVNLSLCSEHAFCCIMIIIILATSSVLCIGKIWSPCSWH